ncbi:MAG TPA: inorganic diphosphatase, partial [Acidimicrobiales bacterium]|nr:inorganic diphosphatase [Acidimicrobiales bacterium]
HFFEQYKALEPNKEVLGSGWADRAAAEAEVVAAFERQRQHPH